MIDLEIPILHGICYYQDELKSKIEQVFYHPDSENCSIEWQVVDSLTTSKMYQFGIFYWDGSSSIQDFVLPEIEYFTIIVILGVASRETVSSINLKFGSNSKIGIVEIESMNDVHLFTRSMLDIGSRGIIGVDFADVQSFFPVGVTQLKYAQVTDSVSSAVDIATNQLIRSGGLPCKSLISTVYIATNGNLLDIHKAQEKLQTAEISESLIINGYVDPKLDASEPGIVHVGLISFAKPPF